MNPRSRWTCSHCTRCPCLGGFSDEPVESTGSRCMALYFGLSALGVNYCGQASRTRMAIQPHGNRARTSSGTPQN
ncbi:hypothetical protein K402DRAFT_397910, partial [Aulographum hederae CBS 113979]